MVEIKVGMKAIIVNSKNHADYNFKICEIKEIENSKRICVEIDDDKFKKNFYVQANEIIPLAYENPEDLKKYGITVEVISKLFTEYKGYYDVICSVADDISRELDEKEKKYKSQIEEMQHHIDCLIADLEKAQDNKILLPHEPIKVAEMLIDSDKKFVIQRELRLEETKICKRYSKSDLRQIAGHLLVYCNNSEDGE